MMNIYVGNLSYQTTDDELRDAFANFGEVTSAKVIKDMQTGRSKGFGFVEMADKAQAEEAIGQLDNTDLDGRSIRVNEARPKPPRDGGDFRARRPRM